MTSNTPNTPNTTAAAVDDDIQALSPPQAIRATIDGHQFEFRPLRVRQFFPFLALARPIFAALAEASSAPASGLPPPPASGQGGEPTPAPGQPAAVDVAALASNTDLVFDVLQNHGPAAIRALAVALEANPEEDAQRAMVERLEDLTVVGLLVAFRHFVQLNASFFAAQGLRLTMGQGLGASMPTDADRARAGSAAAGARPIPRRKR